MMGMHTNNGRASILRLVLTGLLAASVFAATSAPRPAVAADPPPVNFKAARKQGIHYYKKKLYAPAIATLEKAGTTKKGAKDFRTFFYLAKACEALLKLEKAFPAARRAVENAKSDDDKEDGEKLLRTLENYYAGVRFEQHPDQPEKFEEGGIIILKPTRPIINPKKKKVFQQIADRFEKEKVKLPITLYLPFGEYEANGAPFKIVKGKEAKAKLFLYGEAPGLPVWWIVGGGAAAVGLTLGILLPILLSEDTQTAKLEPSLTLIPATDGAQ